MKKIVSFDGAPIAYWTSGTGPALVLVHGTTADHTRWQLLLPLLEPHVTVYAMDRRGRGASGDAPDYALEYARSRETMGKPIAEHQLIAGKLADMETRCEAARGLLYRFGRMVDEGAADAELTKASAMAKLACTDAAMWVTTEAVQVLGNLQAKESELLHVVQYR